MRTPQLFLEQICLREKKASDLPEARRAGLTDESVAKAISNLEASNREILSTYSSDAMKAAIARKMAQRKRPPLHFNPKSVFTVRNLTVMTTAAACLAFTVFLAGPRGGSVVQNIVGSGFTNGSGILTGAERAKGDGPRLYIYLKDGNQAIQLDNNSIVHEGDMLQMSYIAAGAQYGIILSIDGNGTVTQHYPDAGATAGKLDNTGEIPLPFAYKLDNAPSYERFFFITGAKSFTVASFIENIRMRTRIGDMKDADLTRIVPMNTRLTELTLLK